MVELELEIQSPFVSGNQTDSDSGPPTPLPLPCILDNVLSPAGSQDQLAGSGILGWKLVVDLLPSLNFGVLLVVALAHIPMLASALVADAESRIE